MCMCVCVCVCVSVHVSVCVIQSPEERKQVNEGCLGKIGLQYWSRVLYFIW